MTRQTLQAAIDQAGGALSYLRSTKYHLRENDTFFPPIIIPQIPYEMSDWTREQRAWRESVALFDQSHHMQAAIVRGPDARAFLSHLACNNLKNAHPGRAFQIICASPDGNMIGDGILIQNSENEFAAIGPFLLSWMRYQAEVLPFDVTVDVDARSPVYANGHSNIRPECRYQIQGPKAWALIEKLNGGPIEDVAFFHVTSMTIAGHRIGALRHGMAGTPGLEIWAPWDLRDTIRDTILKEGEEFGIVEVGAASYCVSGIESGWLQGVLSDIYSSESTRGYREWLSVNDLEGVNRLSGSQNRKTIEEYYRTPYDIGYGRLIHLEHEFIGRDALRAMGERPALQKVSLAWHPDDAAQLMREMLLPDGKNVKALHLPIVTDKIEIQYNEATVGGRSVGAAHYTAYLANEKAIITLSLLDPSLKIGDEVVIDWGELGGGSGQHAMPATDIIPIRATVSPAPYSRVAREEYRNASVGA